VPLVQPLNFFSRIGRSADHFHGRSYLLLGCQPVPGQHSLLQVAQSGPVVESRGAATIDVDFVVVADFGDPE